MGGNSPAREAFTETGSTDPSAKSGAPAELALSLTRGPRCAAPLADTAGFAADLACAKFLELVDAYAAEQKPLHPRSGPSYAPKVFSEDPRSDGISKPRFKTAMAMLFDNGAIVEDVVVVNRKSRRTIVRVAKG